MFIRIIRFSVLCSFLFLGILFYVHFCSQVFCLIMMIISSLLYAAIFGHVTTIIHNMTQATAKYHEMLDAVR